MIREGVDDGVVPGPKTIVKATQAEFEQRVDELFTLSIRGANTRDLRRHASGTWGLTRRQIERYLAEVTKRLKEAGAVKRAEEYGRAIAQLCDLYSRNFRVQDYKAALAVRQELSKLLDLNPARKTEATILFDSPSFHAFVDFVLDLLGPYPEALDAVLGGMRAKFPALAAAEPEPITVEAVEADETEEGEER